ncbi:MAG: class I SAM-dependent methyltransferase [Dehalococcoidia bacterium]|nr:MAG: class I SAM-dependent methyltransferase [Dehalococcoidia bacterium]
MTAHHHSDAGEQAQRAAEYERWLGSSSLSAVGIRWWMGPIGQWFANAPLYRLKANLKLDRTVRLLDIGVGRGTVMRMLDDTLECDRAPVGLDVSRTVLRLAAQDEENPERGAGLVQGSATALPFADGSFNLVLCGHLVKHLDDDDARAFFIEVRRVLEPGGLALIWEFGPTGNRALDAWNARALSSGVRRPRLRSTKTLRRLAEESGFTFTRDAELRPFLLPPIPRASILIGRPPDER